VVGVEQPLKQVVASRPESLSAILRTMDSQELLRRITVDPEVCNGKPTIRGKRITVQTILEFLGAGEDREEILRQYPSLEPADIDASVAFAA
jgi:uncharacterized protein (DUF433 family)